MMDLELKGELPTPRSSFSIFDPKIHLAIYGSSLYELYVSLQLYPLAIRIRHIWSLRERLRAVCVSHLPWGLRSSGLVLPCSSLKPEQLQPKERHRSSPISPRNCMIRIIFFSHCIHFAILQRLSDERSRIPKVSG